jgi:hypothetical protein
MSRFTSPRTHLVGQRIILDSMAAEWARTHVHIAFGHSKVFGQAPKRSLSGPLAYAHFRRNFAPGAPVCA